MCSHTVECCSRSIRNLLWRWQCLSRPILDLFWLVCGGLFCFVFIYFFSNQAKDCGMYLWPIAMAFFFIEDNVHVYKARRVFWLSSKIGMSEYFSLLEKNFLELHPSRLQIEWPLRTWLLRAFPIWNKMVLTHGPSFQQQKIKLTLLSQSRASSTCWTGLILLSNVLPLCQPVCC